jgi:hypothetical protein
MTRWCYLLLTRSSCSKALECARSRARGSAITPANQGSTVTPPNQSSTLLTEHNTVPHRLAALSQATMHCRQRRRCLQPHLRLHRDFSRVTVWKRSHVDPRDPIQAMARGQGRRVNFNPSIAPAFLAIARPNLFTSAGPLFCPAFSS